MAKASVGTPKVRRMRLSESVDVNSARILGHLRLSD